MVNKVAGAQVVVNKVAGAQMVDQVAGVQVVVNLIKIRSSGGGEPDQDQEFRWWWIKWQELM